MKKVVWAGSSRKDLRAMPENVKDEIGFGLYHAEVGLPHALIKILKGFGSAGVQEIKANDFSGTYRAVYTIKFKNYLYVLHVFQKKSKEADKTPQPDMDLIKQRLAWAEADFKQRSKSDE